MIKTNNNQVAIAGVKTERYFTTWYPKSWGMFIKCNSNGDTMFTRLYRRNFWNADSIYLVFERISQLSVDSSFIISGYLIDYLGYISTVIVRYDKNGEMIWDKIIKLNSIIKDQYCTGTWTINNKIYLSLLSGGNIDHGLTWYNNYILEMDTSGALISTKYFTQPPMHGGLYYTKYSEEKTLFFGQSDTLLSYVGMGPETPGSSDLWFGSYEVTVAGGMLDKDNNLLWRWLRPMDTLGGNEVIIPEAGKRLHDGSIIFFGSRGSNDLPNNTGFWGAWIIKTDSNGNRIWDRVYRVKEALHPETDDIYMSDVCEADNGDIILTGTEMQIGNVQHAWTLRIDSNGNLSPTDSGFVGTDQMGNYPYITIYQNFQYPNATIEVGLLAKEKMKLFPNPAQESLYILYNAYHDGVLNIYNILGQKVYSQNVKAMQNQLTIGIGNLISGQYIVEYMSGKDRMTEKFIKL